jgi:RES domain-containing protein
MTLDVTNVNGIDAEWTASRQAGIGYPPLWLPPLRAHSKPQPSGRWHTEGKCYAQYFALHEDASWAELVRYEGTRTDPERCHLLFRLWRMRIKERNIADLSTFDLIQESGLEPAQFVNDDQSYCRKLATALKAAGFRGLLAPSAAYPGATNLTLFGARRECKMDEQNRRPNHYVGCHLVADRAAPPPHVLEKTRYWDEPHEGLYEWELQSVEKASAGASAA